MGNYSKRSQKPKFEKVVKAKMKVLNLFEKQEKAEVKELYPMTSQCTDQWQYIKGVLDSGAEESVAHPSMCPQYPVVPSAGSKAGQSYTSASGDDIPNLGEQFLPVVLDDGWETTSRYQSAEVSRPLDSVSQICDAGESEDGQLVVFSKYGGVNLNLASWRKTNFEREGGIYTLGKWVKPPNVSSGFPGPGR